MIRSYGSLIVFAAAGSFMSSAVLAQDLAQETAERDDSAAAAAVDAFGEQVGLNQAGLYSPVQTRGFDLIAGGGAFRVDGFYFHPAALPSDSLVEGSSVNVGIAATGLDLPSPTGVVNYRLRDPGPRTSLSITAGLREEQSPAIELLGTLVSEDQRWGLVGHTLIMPDANRSSGEDGPVLQAAAVGRWSPGMDTRLRLFGSYGKSDWDGDISVLAAGPGVPPPLRPRFRYGPDWARSSSSSGNAGVLFEHRLDDWSVGASAVRSVNRARRSDVTVLEVDRDGDVAATTFHTPSVRSRSNSIELKLARTLEAFGAEHRLGVALRQRSSVTGRALAAEVPLGNFTLEEGPPDLPAPALPDDYARGEDKVDQRILSATYGLRLGDMLDVRLGAHSNRYEKRVSAFDGTRSRAVDQTWLYSASAVWRPKPSWQIFASYVGGLEEAGTAPAAAANRGEVLPPVKARQFEIGMRYQVTPELNVIVAAFDIRKPTYGLRTDGIYARAGTVSHRGIEASLTGRLTPTTTVVLGANLARPSVSGELVASGAINRVAPGVSRLNATVSIEQQLTPQLSLDSYFLYEGRRRRDGVTGTEVRSVPWLVLGARYSRQVEGRQVSLRAQLINATGREGYWATPYGPLVAVNPRTYRLLLTADF